MDLSDQALINVGHSVVKICYFNVYLCHLHESSFGIMAKVLDSGLKVSKFKLQSCYYIQFWTDTLGKGIEPPYPCQLWIK